MRALTGIDPRRRACGRCCGGRRWPSIPGTDLPAQHPDYLLLGKDGKPRKITWWDAYYLCPAYAPGQAPTPASWSTKMLRDWGYDGLKLDGQHLNGAPPCYNPAHGHASPDESFEKLPELFQLDLRHRPQPQARRPGRAVPLRDRLRLPQHAVLQHARGVGSRRAPGRCARRARP